MLRHRKAKKYEYHKNVLLDGRLGGISRLMDTIAIAVIDYLGGAKKVAELLETPKPTIYAWRKSGIPRSRLAHMRLAGKDIGMPLPDDLSTLLKKD